MATKVNFAGKLIGQPGTYAQILSGQTNPPQTLDYGKIIIIDTGGFYIDSDESGISSVDPYFGGGAGIDGELASGKNAIYSLNDLTEYRKFLTGGWLWLLGEPLFRPNGLVDPGVSSVYYVRAATTLAAQIAFTFTGGGPNGGSLLIKCKNEGTVSNGYLCGTELTRGVGVKMVAGTIETSKFVLKFYRGTFKGLDLDGHPFDGIKENDASPELICQTPEFDNLQTAIDWMNLDSVFNAFFKLSSSSVSGTGIINTADMLANPGYKLAAGGTDSYTANALNLVLDNISELDYTIVLSDRWGDDAQHAYNTTILAHLINEARYDKFLFIGGGRDKNKFVNTSFGSVETAKYYDSDRVVVVHGGCKKIRQWAPAMLKEYDSIYKTAAIVGRTCGLSPQIPLTFKAIDIDGELHLLNEKERQQALNSGVLHTKFDSEFNPPAFVVNQGITTLQANDFLVNDDGTSHELTIRRIAAQLNKELVVNAKRMLLGNQQQGPNRFTLNATVIKTWTENYLKGKVATPTQDNLIISFNSVTANISQDYINVTYRFEPNGPINKIFFTGYMINL
ncbi:MAG TPA: hypothetical protein PKY56_02595 [Candidatus Kapabacteria bacterium]|nr:hypothetical protein [Candidatus Kapabacteria bacterium]